MCLVCCLVDGSTSVWYNWSHVGVCECVSKTLMFEKNCSSESDKVRKRGTREKKEQNRTEQNENETERNGTKRVLLHN